MQDQKVTLAMAVLQILETTSKLHPLNSKQICRKLVDLYHYDIGCEAEDCHKIYKMIGVLESAGINIVHCPKKKEGYYLIGHVSLWETLMRIDYIAQSKAISTIEKKVAIEAIKETLPEEYRRIISKMPIVDAKFSIIDNRSFENINMTIKSIYEGKRIAFQYIAYDIEMVPFLKHSMKFYIVSPYMIHYYNDTCYLIGAESDTEAGTDIIKHFRFDRITNLCALNEPSINPKMFFKDNPYEGLKDYILKSVDHYGGEEIRLELEVHYSTTAMDIIKDKCGNTFECKKYDEDHALISFKIRSGPTLIGWLMQNMQFFKVVGPANIVEEIKEAYRYGLAQYR